MRTQINKFNLHSWLLIYLCNKKCIAQPNILYACIPCTPYELPSSSGKKSQSFGV